MSQHESRILDSQPTEWVGSTASYDDIVSQPSTRPPATDEAGAAIARQLNGPLTALLLYMGEIRQHSHQFPAAERDYLQPVGENDLRQPERVCAELQRIGTNGYEPATQPTMNNA